MTKESLNNPYAIFRETFNSYDSVLKNGGTIGTNNTISNGEIISLDSHPNIISYYIVGQMSNSTYSPTSDQRANAMMKSFKKRDMARRGYYYINDGEDPGSVSAVVPYAKWLVQV